MNRQELTKQGYSKKEIKEIEETYNKTGYHLVFVPKKLWKGKTK